MASRETVPIRPPIRRGRGADGHARLALLGEREAVKAGGGVGRRAGGVDQDGGDRGPHGDAPRHPRGQGDRRRGIQPEGERDQQRQARGAAQPRHKAEEHAEPDAEEEIDHLLQSQEALKAAQPGLKDHFAAPVARTPGGLARSIRSTRPALPIEVDS